MELGQLIEYLVPEIGDPGIEHRFDVADIRQITVVVEIASLADC